MDLQIILNIENEFKMEMIKKLVKFSQFDEIGSHLYFAILINLRITDIADPCVSDNLRIYVYIRKPTFNHKG